jgi:hypothetical protein
VRTAKVSGARKRPCTCVCAIGHLAWQMASLELADTPVGCVACGNLAGRHAYGSRRAPASSRPCVLRAGAYDVLLRVYTYSYVQVDRSCWYPGTCVWSLCGSDPGSCSGRPVGHADAACARWIRERDVSSHQRTVRQSPIR